MKAGASKVKTIRVIGQRDTSGTDLAKTGLAGGLAAALEWWREAGVDCAFTDAPQNWLEAAAAPVKQQQGAATPPPVPGSGRSAQPLAPAAPETALIAPDSAMWPKTLPDFVPWWLSEPTLAPRGLPRVPPRGPAAAALMVLVPMPAQDDIDTLLSGRTGRLLDAMLAAFGFDPAHVYRASALPARIALPDWAGLAGAGLGAVLARHVALAAPQRLLVFGRSDISALMGHDSAHTAPHLRGFNHDSGSVTARYEYDLETLLTKPGWKAGVWQRWLDGAPD